MLLAILITFAVLAVPAAALVFVELRRAPEGCEDEVGFHRKAISPALTTRVTTDVPQALPMAVSRSASAVACDKRRSPSKEPESGHDFIPQYS